MLAFSRAASLYVGVTPPQPKVPLAEKALSSTASLAKESTAVEFSKSAEALSES